MCEKEFFLVDMEERKQENVDEKETEVFKLKMILYGAG